jgi:translation initiation factor IF-2
MGGGPAPAPDAAGAKGPAKGAPRPGDAKKKQKRTVFSDKDKGPNRLAPARGSQFTSTVIRSRRKRRGEKGGGGGGGDSYVLDEPVIITGPITVGELAEIAHVTPAQIISQLIGMGVLATINQMIEPEQAVAALEKLEIEAHFGSDLAEQASWRLTATTTGGEATGEIRPPVVTILGHVDHGKTTLLDSIRNTNVTAQEFGGITQHIGAYQVEIKGQKITFLDTPGHAAFTAMRARGANLTDIAILVVAADDGVQPQTVEAIDHAKAAKVPIIVAINKIDLPDAQPDIVKQALTSYDLVSEDYGGDTIMVPLSAKKGMNIEQLLEMILLVAEVQELRAEADLPARGAVVESKLDKQRGPVATMLVQEGTLKVGDALVVGMVSGKIRAMTDDKGRPLKTAGPSTPVVITGLADVPVAGDLFETVEEERKARDIAEMRQQKARAERLQTHISLQNLSSMVASGLVKDLNIIVKSDVAGSIEAISQALGQVTQNEIRVNIIHAGVGDVTESDVLLADASNAIIVGFHVRLETQARAIAEEKGIDVRLYQVIYDLIDDVEKAMVGMLAPIFEESVLGHAEVRAVFKLTKAGTIAGCYVKDGLVRRGAKVRVLRAGEKVFESNLDSLKHLKDDVREMAQGYECGIGVDNFNAWQEGDIVEAYVIKELRRETL